MSYPGNPPGNGGPNEGYGYPDPNAAGSYPPPPASQPQPQPQPQPQYGAQPVSPAYGQPVSPAYGQPGVPPQAAPTHDQSGGTAQLPTYGDQQPGGYHQQPAAYNLDSSVSAPPTPLGPPASSPPAAYGPVSGGPVSGPVGYGAPMYPDPNAAPAAKKSPVVPILAGLLALMVLATGVFVGLYFDKSGKLDKANKVSAQRQASLDTTNATLEQTKKDLEAKATELSKTQQDLRGTQADSTEAKRQRDVIGKCLTLMYEALAASAANNDPLFDQKFNEMQKPCNEARTLLGI